MDPDRNSDKKSKITFDGGKSVDKKKKEFIRDGEELKNSFRRKSSVAVKGFSSPKRTIDQLQEYIDEKDKKHRVCGPNCSIF